VDQFDDKTTSKRSTLVFTMLFRHTQTWRNYSTQPKFVDS